MFLLLLFVFYIIAELKPVERREKSINQRRCSCLGCVRGLWSPGRNWGRNRIHTYIGACSYMHRSVCMCIFIYFFSVCMCIVNECKPHKTNKPLSFRHALTLFTLTHTHACTFALCVCRCALELFATFRAFPLMHFAQIRKINRKKGKQLRQI